MSKKSKLWLEVYALVYDDMKNTMSNMDWDDAEYVEELHNKCIKLTNKIYKNAKEAEFVRKAQEGKPRV